MKHAPGFIALVERVRPRIREIHTDEVAASLRNAKPFVLIDVREDHEFNAGHIAGALHIGRGILERDIEAKVPDKHADIVLYCGGGYRSALAADSLQQMGYAQVRSMAGGWREWSARGYPHA